MGWRCPNPVGRRPPVVAGTAEVGADEELLEAAGDILGAVGGRDGLVPTVRGLGPAVEVHLLAARALLGFNELHFVLNHQGYHYQFVSLAPALEQHLGYGWRNAVAPAESKAGQVCREQRLAQLLQFTRRSSRFQRYREAIKLWVDQAQAKRTRRLGRKTHAVP
jgi:hypothetical protein